MTTAIDAADRVAIVSNKQAAAAIPRRMSAAGIDAMMDDQTGRRVRVAGVRKNPDQQHQDEPADAPQRQHQHHRQQHVRWWAALPGRAFGAYWGPPRLHPTP